ncbi:MAG: hypothetical protein EAZ11_03880 [Curvibacter sp.]|nr:MAG: hypothetical protein EAZ11_03880 [Curvibacter sp.]
MYLPAFEGLKMSVKVTGFTSRQQKNRQRFSETTGYKAFETAQQLVQETAPDFLIVAVSPEANAAVVHQLLNYKIPLIVETPLAWNKRQGQYLVDKAHALGVDLFVMEQFPYFPLEQMKRKLLDAGVFGRVYAAYNDFASYSYHAIAQLRGYSNAKIISVSCKETHFPFATPPGGSQPVWQQAEFNFDDGGVMYHHYSSNYVDNPLCGPKALRFYGERGSMVNDVIRALGKSDEVAHELKVLRQESAEGFLQRLSVTVPGYDEFVWENRFASKPLNDEQLAVATLLNSIFSGGDEVGPYSGREFVNDIDVMQAMQFSSFHGGAEIRCPVNERREKIRKLFCMKFWRQKLLRDGLNISRPAGVKS